MAASIRIGHGELDADHDRMIAAWRELESSPTIEVAKAAAARLMAEASDHFAREEMIMAQCGFPDLARHRLLHAEMAVGLRRVVLSPLVGAGQHLDFILAMRSLMEKWVMAHILGEDSKLEPYLRGRSAAPRRAMAAGAR